MSLRAEKEEQFHLDDLLSQSNSNRICFVEKQREKLVTIIDHSILKLNEIVDVTKREKKTRSEGCFDAEQSSTINEKKNSFFHICLSN